MPDTTRLSIVRSDASTTRREKDSPLRLLKLIDDIVAFRNRVHTLDMGRLEEKYQSELETATKAAERSVRGGAHEELSRARQEARRVVDMAHQESKTMLASKFDRFDADLQALAEFLKAHGPLAEATAQLAARQEKVRRDEEELASRQAALARKEQASTSSLLEIESLQGDLVHRKSELDAAMANLEVVRRAEELNQLREEIEGKMKAYEGEMANLVRQRQEINRDFDQLGEKRAELDQEAEALEKDRAALREEKASLTRVVAREVGQSFEKLIMEMIENRPPA